MFSLQASIIQMAADKNSVKKNKPNKRLYTRTYVYCKQNQNKTKKREGKRKWSKAQHVRLRI